MTELSTKVDIDFARVATLMDVVQKVASVTPAYTALSSVAMNELKAMNDEAQVAINDLGQRRLEAERKAQAELAEHNRKAMEEQAKADRERDERTAVSQAQPRSIMPGEPVPDSVRIAADRPIDKEPNDTDHKPIRRI